MKVFLVSVFLVALACTTAAGDLKAKARLVGKLFGRGKHHKRGVFSSVPPFKVGHDIPHVTHSILKPLVITYPPTALPFAVKVPLTHRFPVPVGHRVPVPHPHFGLKFPHHTKFAKPDQHFHHHHHHVARPAVPLLPAPAPAPVLPVAQPSVPVAHPLPAPQPPLVFQPTPIIPAQPTHVAPTQVLPPHIHFKPVLPAPVALPAAPLLPAPVVPVAPHYNYVLRPGNAVQTSLFATYPRYPLVNYHTPVFPLSHPIQGQVLLDRPAQVPHYHFGAAAGHSFLEQSTPVAVKPTPALFPHVDQIVGPQVTQLDHDGWSPVQAQGYEANVGHFEQHQHHHVTQEQVPQVYEHHDEQQYNDEHFHEQQQQYDQQQQLHNQQQQFHEHQQQFHDQQQYNELQHQLQQHIQHQLDHQLHQQSNINQEYGAPNEYQHPNHDYSQGSQDYAQPSQEYGAPQEVNQEYGAPQLEQQYGAPQGFEGRSSEHEEEQPLQKFHNHIPLGLQPPIERPPENFR